MKKHLAAALIAAAVPALLVSPAGAAPSYNPLRCQGGRVAKVTQVDGKPKGNFDNKCRHQWLVLSWYNSESDGMVLNVPPLGHGPIGVAAGVAAQLSSAPMCTEDLGVVEVVTWVQKTKSYGPSGCPS